MTPRGIRLNNPLNIRRSASQWRGMSAVQDDAAFVRFDSMEWGLRAAFCLLRTYARRHGAQTPAAIIGRWAPPTENNTRAYVAAVCRRTGFGGQQRLTEAEWPRLVQAMAEVETGCRLPYEIINRGFNLYKKYR